MTIIANTVLGDTWRIAVTLIVLLVIGVGWSFVVSNITPFSGGSSRPADDDGQPAAPRRRYPQLRPSRYPKVQRFSVTCDIVLFVWIVLEGVIVVPLMLIKYGLH
ncbi:MAG: hypothetical protein ACYDHH_07050 [Solirubrobacteraceae bacterium]